MNDKSHPIEMSNSQPRLASLDALRGFDMFLLVFFQPVLVAVGEAADVEWLNSVIYQFEHAEWIGFRFWDIIMPLFMFMCGAAMPFSFSKYLKAGSKTSLYVRILKRVIVLWIIGMVVQGNLLAFNLNRLALYSNTLQAIAIGYLIGSLIVLNLKFKGQIVVTVLLLAVYWIPMTFCGDYTPAGNFAMGIDKAMLGHYRDGVLWTDAGWQFYEPYQYTWLWSSLTFSVTVMLGCFCGDIIKTGTKKTEVLRKLLITGVCLIIAALIWHVQMPIIKKLWTCSMTLLAGGFCFLLMALFYWWIDMRGHLRGLEWLKVYGMNSITAYVLGEVVNFRSIAESLTFGFQRFMGEMWYQAWLTFANFGIVFLILMMMYKRRIFIKF